MNFLDKLADIDTFIFDVDGVMTDGFVLINEDGDLFRKMNTKDGYALRFALDKGYRIFIITGGKSISLFKRLHNLGIPEHHIFMDAQDKVPVLTQLVKNQSLDLSKSVYMGDDLPDYPCMRLVHLPCCPKDAVVEIRELAAYVSNHEGGKGCVRDIIEKVLRVQNNWFQPNKNQ